MFLNLETLQPAMYLQKEGGHYPPIQIPCNKNSISYNHDCLRSEQLVLLLMLKTDNLLLLILEEEAVCEINLLRSAVDLSSVPHIYESLWKKYSRSLFLCLHYIFFQRLALLLNVCLLCEQTSSSSSFSFIFGRHTINLVCFSSLCA